MDWFHCLLIPVLDLGNSKGGLGDCRGGKLKIKLLCVPCQELGEFYGKSA